MQFIKDEQIPGLYLMPKVAGGGTWYLQKRVANKVVKVRLGDSLTTSAVEARAKAIAALKDLAEGRNPFDQERRARSSLKTVAEIFDIYYTEHLARNTARPEEHRSAYNRLWAAIRSNIVARLTTIDIQRWCNKIAESVGPAQASKQLSLLRAALRWACKMQLIVLDVDPCSGVQGHVIPARERYLVPGEEVERLRVVLDRNAGDTADAIWMLLYTGQRKSNVLSMRWDEIDLESQTWQIPAAKVKGKATVRRKPIRVPLTQLALDILERHKDNGSQWVFPSDSKTGHLVSINKTWERWRAEAGLHDLRLHDLRHTFASWMGMTNASAFIIQRALGHSSSKTTERYTHLSIEAIRGAAERAQQLRVVS